MKGTFYHFKQLFKDTITYGLASILSKFISVFLTPFYTRIFSPDDYGIMAILNSFISIINILAILSLDNSTARWFYDNEDTADRKNTINTFGWFVLMSTTIFAILLFVISDFLAVYFFNNINVSLYFKIVALSLPITSWSNVAIKILRYSRKVKMAVTISLLGMLLTVSLNILLVLFLDLKLTGVYYAMLITSTIVTVISVFSIKEWLTLPKIDFQRLKEMLKFSLPMIPGNISSWVVSLSSSYLLMYFMGISDVGLFQIGTMLASAFLLLTTAFSNAFSPYALSIINQKDSKKIYADFFKAYILFTSMMAFLIVIFSQDILILLTTSEYYSAYIVASILTVSYLVTSLIEFASLGLAIVKNTKYIGISMMISAFSLVVFSPIFIPVWGKEGAALNVLFSQILGIAYMFYHSQRLYFVPYFKAFHITQAVLLIIFAFLILFLVNILNFNYITNFILKVSISLLFILSVLTINKKSYLSLIGIIKK